jgi:hypothetical protein
MSRNGYVECILSRNIPPGSTMGRRRTHCISIFDRTQDECSDIEYDVLNLENFILGKNIGRFITFFVITNIFNKKNKGPTLMELFTATGKLKKFFLTTRNVRCVHHG